MVGEIRKELSPVVSDGQPVSMLSIRDLHAHLLQVPPGFARAPDEP